MKNRATDSFLLWRGSIFSECEDVLNAAVQHSADAVQHEAVIADNLVFEIFIDDVILNPCPFCQLIPGHLVLRQCGVQGDFYHDYGSFFMYSMRYIPA